MSIFFPVFVKNSLFSTESSSTACVLFIVEYIKDGVFLLLKILENRSYSYFSENLVLPISRDMKITF